MKKSISKVIMLTFAVVLMFSTLGLTTAFAAPISLVLDSGTIAITASGANLAVTQGGVSKGVLAAGEVLTINAPANKNVQSGRITVGAKVTNVNINLNATLTPTIPSTSLQIATGSTVTLSGTNVLTGGISGGVANNIIGGTLNLNGGTTINGGVSLSALNQNGGTATVNGGVNGGAINATAGTLTLGAGTVTAPITATGGILNINGSAVNAPVTVKSNGAFNLNAGSITSPITVSGGTFTSKSTISGAVNVAGGIFNLNAGSITNAVTIGGGTFNLNGGNVTGNVTLNSGTLAVSNNAKAPASLNITGGTYKNGDVQLYKTVVTLPRSTAFSGSITYSYRNGAAGRDGVTANVINGKFTAYLPAGSTTITTTADGIIYTKPGAAIAANDTNAVTLTCDAALKGALPDITSYYTGTSFGNLPLPKTITVTLGGSGNKTAELPVVWNQTGSNYSSQSTAKQTIKGTITLPSDITMSPNNSITINVILKRSSSGGGTSSKEPNHEYEFWSDILGEVENASSGETVYAYANKYDNVPSTILEKMKGKNITLEITRSSGSDIIIKGKNIKSLEAGRITYSLSQLSSLSKNQWSSKASSAPIGEPSTNEPTTAPSTAPSYTYKPPSSTSAPAESSSEESAASPEIAEESSSEEEEIVIDSEPETTPTDTPTDVKPKAKLSPVSIAIIITVIAAVLSGIIACIILQRRSKHDQF